MRVAQNNLRAHVNQFIHKKQAAFEHFLVNQHAATRLGGDDQDDRHQVGCETRPGGVVNRQNGAVNKSIDFIVILGGDMQVVAPALQADTQFFEGGGYESELVNFRIFDRDFGLRHGGQSDETANFNHIRQAAVFCTLQAFDAFDVQQVRADAFNFRTHAHQHPAELLHIRFAGGVVNRSFSLRQYSGHHDICRARHRNFVHVDIRAAQAARWLLHVIDIVFVVVFEFRAELLQSVEVGIEASATDFIAAGFWERSASKPGEQRADKHHRSAQALSVAHKFCRAQV